MAWVSLSAAALCALVLPCLLGVGLAAEKPGQGFCMTSNAESEYYADLSPLERRPQTWKGDPNTEVVVVAAHYRQDLQWLYERQPFDHFVVSKCCPELGWTNHTLPINKGTEAAVYTKFIVDHYDHLPQRMIFLHAHEKAHHTTVRRNYVLCEWERSGEGVGKRLWFFVCLVCVGGTRCCVAEV